MILDAYKGSLVGPVNVHDTYPNITSFTQMHATHSVKFSDLFKHAPGIYYNFTCRPSCDPQFQEKTIRRRIKSGERGMGRAGNARTIQAQLFIGGPTIFSLQEWIKRRERHKWIKDKSKDRSKTRKRPRSPNRSGVRKVSDKRHTKRQRIGSKSQS
jgi:hypothetical protein